MKRLNFIKTAALSLLASSVPIFAKESKSGLEYFVKLARKEKKNILFISPSSFYVNELSSLCGHTFETNFFIKSQLWWINGNYFLRAALDRPCSYFREYYDVIVCENCSVNEARIKFDIPQNREIICI